MRSCLRISSTKEEIKIMINVATDFNDVIDEFRAKLPRITKYYNKDKKPIRIVGKALNDYEQAKQ